MAPRNATGAADLRVLPTLKGTKCSYHNIAVWDLCFDVGRGPARGVPDLKLVGVDEEEFDNVLASRFADLVSGAGLTVVNLPVPAEASDVHRQAGRSVWREVESAYAAAATAAGGVIVDGSRKKQRPRVARVSRGLLKNAESCSGYIRI